MCRSICSLFCLLALSSPALTHADGPPIVEELVRGVELVEYGLAVPVSPVQQAQMQRAVLIKSLEQLEAAYTGAGMLDEAKIVLQQLLRLQAEAAVELPEIDRSKWPSQLHPNQLRDHVGEVHVLLVTGSNLGNVWGSGIYTDDSDVGTAAVHAGILELGESHLVAFRLLPGREAYTSSSANGVVTRDYGPWKGSFQLIGRCILESAFTVPPFDRTVPPFDRVRTVDVFVTGRTNGDVIGSGPYTINSDLGAAAVHAGLLVEGETGVIRVKLLPPQEKFVASRSHGVESQSSGPSGPCDGSIQLLPVSH